MSVNLQVDPNSDILIPEPILRIELELFADLMENDFQLLPDPAWLALLISTLWSVGILIECLFMLRVWRVACYFYLQEMTVSPDTCPPLGFTDASIHLQIANLHQARKLALNNADWMSRPQIRVLQALLVSLSLE